MGDRWTPRLKRLAVIAAAVFAYFVAFPDDLAARGAHPGADDGRLAVALRGAGRGRGRVGNHARLRAKARFPAPVTKFGQTPGGL